MRIFKTIRKTLKMSGFRSNESVFNSHNVRGISISATAIVMELLYVRYDADTVEEYMLCFFMLTIGIGLFISFLSTICRKTEVYDLIDKIQAITAKSE